MVGDVRISECRSLGDIYIYDLSEVRLGRLAKLTPTILKKCEVTARVSSPRFFPRPVREMDFEYSDRCYRVPMKNRKPSSIVTYTYLKPKLYSLSRANISYFIQLISCDYILINIHFIVQLEYSKAPLRLRKPITVQIL